MNEMNKHKEKRHKLRERERERDRAWRRDRQTTNTQKETYIRSVSYLLYVHVSNWVLLIWP